MWFEKGGVLEMKMPSVPCPGGGVDRRYWLSLGLAEDFCSVLGDLQAFQPGLKPGKLGVDAEGVQSAKCERMIAASKACVCVCVYDWSQVLGDLGRRP